MMKKLLVFVAVCALVAPAMAQTAPAPPTPQEMAQHQVDRLTHFLSLTSAQQAQALTIFTNAATAGATLHDSLKTAHDALTAAIEANNTTGIDQATAAIGNLMGQESNIRAKADAAFYQVLTADQKTQYAKLLGHGPGGFGGPGMGPRMRRGGGPPQE
ncbi:MAG TPA: Spy/CpxP family protein refolding chaperone [Terriglobales bacterium]|nr:Spy/CpxP family protein refolding chaperone [Terriglobales bacterium]